MLTEVPDSPTTFALRPGTVVADAFRISRPIPGGSAYAITYLAEDLSHGEAMVVKEFFPRSLVARAPDGVTARPHAPESGRDFLRALRRFVIEGSVLSEIAHPHVVRARGLVEANGTAYLMMDQYHSQPLSEYLRVNGGRLGAPAAGRIVQHLLTALEPLHADSVVHRDLSPRSVHVQGDGSVLLLEFSARRHLPLHATDLATGFAAFEQYGMRDIGPWTDVYSASAILYYLLTGVVPPSALDRAAGEPLQPPTALAPNLSPGLARLILRGMSLLPQQRPHVASELRRQLETLLTEGQAPRGQMNVAAESLAPLAPPAPLDSALPDDDGRGGALKLAAGGVVLPGEDRNGGLLGRLGSAAARLRRNAVAAASAPREDLVVPQELEAERERPVPLAPTVAQKPVPTAPLHNEVLVADVPRPAALPALRPSDERALPTVEERARPLDIAMQLALVQEEMEAGRDAPNKRRRYSLLAAAALVIAIGGSLAFLARSSSASSSGLRPTPDQSAKASTARTGPVPAQPAHEVVEAGAMLPSARHVDSTVARSAAAPKVRAPEVAERRAPAATPAPAPRVETVLPAGKLPNVNVAIAGPSTDVKLVSPEMLVDARTRLARGQDAADEGDYSVARRAFRGALQQLDSLASRYPASENLRSLHRDVEQADTRALQACNAENEMRKRRGEPGKACQ